MFTRQEIEAMKLIDRPRVRCMYDCQTVTEDGIKTPQARPTDARIIVDGNNPWLEFWAAGRYYAERFSWGLILDVLNDRFAAPVWLSQKGIVYEV